MQRVKLAAAVVCAAVLAAPVARAADGPPQKVDNGVLVPLAGATLKVEVCTDDVVRIAYAGDAAVFDRPSLVTAPKECGGATWHATIGASSVVVQTAKLRVTVSRMTGRVRFTDLKGVPILSEASRSLAAAEVQGERTFHVRRQWLPNADESLYGLGQQQLGLMDIKGYDLDLGSNVSDVVPVLVSSRGYGILWNNMSLTRFGDLRTAASDAGGSLDEAVARRPDRPLLRRRALSVRWLARRSVDRHPAGGQAVAEHERIHPALRPRATPACGGSVHRRAGHRRLHVQTFSNAGLKMWVDDRLVVDHWRQGWLPWNDVARSR